MPSVVHDVLHRPIVDGEIVLWIHASGYVEPLRYNGTRFISIGFHNGNLVRRLVSPRADSSYIKIPREQLHDALAQRTLETTASFVWHNFNSENQRALAEAFLPLCELYINQVNNSLPLLLLPAGHTVASTTMTIETDKGLEELKIRVTQMTKANPEVELDFDF
jgi:hypothetical protein